jgi:rRNA maturation protein Nop10
MERFRMPGLDLPKKDAGDALNKYRIKDSPGGAAAQSPSLLSPTGADSERRDEDELKSLAQQLATFNRRLTEESLDRYRVPTKKPEGDQKNENEEEEFQIDEEERRQLEAEMQRLLTRKHTLELRRSQRSAGASTGDQATTESTATASAPSRPAGLDRFRVQPSGPGSAPLTPTGTSSSSSSSLVAPVDKNRRLSVSGSDLTVRPTASSSSVSPPQAKPAPLSQTQVGLTASAPARVKSLPATAPVASFNKPTTPTGTSGGGVSFTTPKVKSSFGLPSPRSANANVDPFSKYRVQNNADAPAAATAGEGKSATVVVADVRPLTPTVSDPFSKYRIAPSGGSGEASPLASAASGEAVRDVKPAPVDPLSKYRKQPDATGSAAPAPASPPKPVAEAAKSSSRPEVSKIAIPDGPRSDEEGAT